MVGPLGHKWILRYSANIHCRQGHHVFLSSVHRVRSMPTGTPSCPRCVCVLVSDVIYVSHACCQPTLPDTSNDCSCLMSQPRPGRPLTLTHTFTCTVYMFPTVGRRTNVSLTNVFTINAGYKDFIFLNKILIFIYSYELFNAQYCYHSTNSTSMLSRI